jgi:hypothetical protein
MANKKESEVSRAVQEIKRMASEIKMIANTCKNNAKKEGKK